MSEHPKSERDVLDRLLVRVPALAGFLSTGVVRVPVGSPLRQRAVKLQVRRAFAAMARSDVEVVQRYYEPEAEVWMNGMVGVGIEGCYRGHDGVRALYADMDDAFGDWSWTVCSIADGGERIAVRTDFVGYGRTSGARTALNGAGTAVKLSPRGLVAEQEWFIEEHGWPKALAAAGLSDG